ncbi:hypothetical protein [Granulicoccus sp. GXG6511]|uniref:hypothetical protein n=1 Tax=Granulicoccus sp. GXG6511 TaxID=3381351 RepID=UPI003D7CB488
MFLEIALETCLAQNHDFRVETIVVPDRMTPEVVAVVERFKPKWPGELSIQPLPMPERVVLPKLNNAFHNYGVQLLTGVQASRGSHVILHDADLFHMERDALDTRYRETADNGLNVSGISPVWDTWFADNDIHIAATWELCANRDWLRAFPRHFHLGHDGELLGEQHTFDITLHAQALSDPAKIRVFPHENIVHFNFVIGAYREFQKSSGPYLDDQFRMLLIRLFIDLFAEDREIYRELPEFDGLMRGLTNENERVFYPRATPELQTKYRDFRVKLDRIIEAEWMSNPERREEAARSLAPFDAHYGYAVVSS